MAVLGAGAPLGAMVCSALATHGVPGSRVDLFGMTGGDAVLSEYDGEPRWIRDADPAEIAGHDAVFVCDPEPAYRTVVTEALAKVLVLDLAAVWDEGGAFPPLVHPDINPDGAKSSAGVIAVPHPVSGVCAEILLSLERDLGIRRAIAVTMCPASDFGEKAVHELRDQTVGLLGLSEVPCDVFGRQLAFNMIPHRLLAGEREAGLERRIAREVSLLLGWGDSRLSVSLVTAPMFHGHAMVVHVDVARDRTMTHVRAALEVASGRGRRRDAAETPADVAGEQRIDVSWVGEDGMGGFWIWAVAGEAGAACADQAVRLAEMAGRL